MAKQAPDINTPKPPQRIMPNDPGESEEKNKSKKKKKESEKKHKKN